MERYLIRGFYRDETRAERDWTRDTLSSAEGLARSIIRRDPDFEFVHVYERISADVIQLKSKYAT